MGDKYEDWHLPELKAELKKRQTKCSGRKRELVERLQSLDFLQVKGVEDMEEEYHMTLPDLTSYNDVNSDSNLPFLPLSRIRTYLRTQDKELEDRVMDMYKQRYLRSIRMAKQDGILYIAARMWAENSKKTAYPVDIAIDSHNVVIDAQCECGGGQGPTAHCKHVACVLYGLHCYYPKREVLTEQTCTQKLQTFHHNKPYKGSPMTATHIRKMRKFRGGFVYDPRPVNRRKQQGYPDHFRNTMLNFQGDRKMSVLQRYQPANPYSVHAEHNYIHWSPEEEYLRREMISNISEEEAEGIEMKSRGQAENSFWKQQRTLRITSSKFGEICKATEIKNLSHLAASMVSPIPFSTKATRHGQSYEPVAVERFEEEHEPTIECGLFINEQYPWLSASPDRVVNSEAVVEVKCPHTSRSKPITPVTVPCLKLVGSELVLKSNHSFYYQVQGQLLCSKRSICYFCVLTLVDFKVIKVQRDEEFIKEMLAKLQLFYQEHFRKALLRKNLYHLYDSYFECPAPIVQPPIAIS